MYLTVASIALSVSLGVIFHKNLGELAIPVFTPTYKDEQLKLLFTGDIFLDRNIDKLSQKSKEKYNYPFSGLSTLEKQKYDAWIGNLECPVTEKQSTDYEEEKYLKFSCKSGYLLGLAEYFDIVSLANNHTDNMGGNAGLLETRENLDKVGIKYFGNFDSSVADDVCKIIFIDSKEIISTKIPIAFCGYHGVYSLPTDEELSVISKYSKYFITFVMPHQGVEYEPRSGTYQKKIYRKMIDLGADAVIGAHPHVIQEVETYKDKLIFYSLGNFIFDQGWSKTREHMTVETQVLFPKYTLNYKKLNCDELTDSECLSLAESLQIIKPEYDLKYKPIFTSSGLDFITKKQELTEKQYQTRLKAIGFDKVATSSKIN